MGAENQQERLIEVRLESSEAIRQLSQFWDKDMVPSAWRHVGIILKEKLSVPINLE